MVLPPTIILDLDDTILDDSTSVEPAWIDACSLACECLQGVSPETLLTLIHDYRDWYWSDPARHKAGRADLRAAGAVIVAEALKRCGVDNPALARRAAGRYRDLREAAIEPFPGAVESLAALRQRGVRLGLITNGAAAVQRAKINRFDLARYFDAVLIEGEFGAGKPEHLVYLELARCLETKPQDSWIVGDNLEWEVAVPATLGFYTVWVDTHARGLPRNTDTKPHRIIQSLPDLLR